MSTICWMISAIASVLSGLALVFLLAGADSAVQEAAGAAVCVAFTVIPYCFARAMEARLPQ